MAPSKIQGTFACAIGTSTSYALCQASDGGSECAAGLMFKLYVTDKLSLTDAIYHDPLMQVGWSEILYMMSRRVKREKVRSLRGYFDILLANHLLLSKEYVCYLIELSENGFYW